MKKLLEALKRLRPKYRKLRRLFDKHEYLDAYSAHRDAKVANKRVSGPIWDQMGRHQFDFLVAHGLKPQHRMFDIGCGQLRGGRFFIEYLEPRGYTGIDISPKTIEYCHNYVDQNGFAGKEPQLLVNEEQHLRFSQFDGQTFDFILAQSVFSHLPGDLIDECFSNLHKIMDADTRFFFTYHKSDTPEQFTIKSFSFPYSFFEGLAERYGFMVEDLTADYNHPRGQDMLCARLQTKA